MRMVRFFFCLLLGGMLAVALTAAAQTNGYQGPAMTESAPPVRPGGSAGQTSPYQGSVSSGPASGQPVSLSLDEALQRGLRYNLGGITAGQAFRRAQGNQIATRSYLFPDLSGGVRESLQQIDLASYGFKLKFPPSLGLNFPTIVGPFNYIDFRAFLSQRVADLNAIRSYQSARETERAAQLSAADSREIVTYVVTASYLLVLAQAARVESAKVQVQTAQAVYQQAADRFGAGLTARIDQTRSQVELETQQQRLTTEQSDYDKDRIAFARLIGLAPGQPFTLTDTMPFKPLEDVTLEQAIDLAQQNRADLKAAQAQVRAAELARKAAVAEHYPTLGVTADYGAIGITPSTAQQTYSVNGSLTIPIWSGNHARGDILEADANLQQRKAEYQDLRDRVEADVRNAFLDLNAAAEQVRVAQSQRDLARDELNQARDRFAAGVADTVEVVQAQEAVATAEADYISYLDAHNLAKAALARATGQAEKTMRDLLRSTP